MLPIVVLAALALAPSAHADEFDEHVARATELARAEQHEAALAAWQAAYAQRQAPRLHYEIARAHQRLGQAREAIAAYERFLAADTGEDAHAKVDAEGQLGRLRRVLSPAAGLLPEPRPVGYEMRRNSGLMKAGITLLSIGYGAAFVTGVTFATIGGGRSDPLDRQFATAGGLLLIPVVGPLISSLYLPSVTRGEGASYWSLPWMLTSAPLQVAGLIMTAVGARDRRKVPVVMGLADRVQVAPYSAPGGGGIVVSGRF